MAIKQVMVSDLTGYEGDESEFIQLIVRRAPGVDRAIALDVRLEEIGDLNEPGDVCLVELRKNGETTGQELIVTLPELSKIAPKGTKIEDVFEKARNLRGRRPGFRNGS